MLDGGILSNRLEYPFSWSQRIIVLEAVLLVILVEPHLILSVLLQHSLLLGLQSSPGNSKERPFMIS